MLNILTDGTLTPSLAHYLILSLMLFTIGIIPLISNANLIKMLFGILIMFNAICLNFIAANTFLTNDNSLSAALQAPKSTLISTFAPLESLVQTFSLPAGNSSALIIMIVAITEIAAGAVIFFAVYLKTNSLNSDLFADLKSDENKKEGEF